MNKNNNIINKYLSVGDKFMPELHLYDPIVKNIVLGVHLLNMNKEFKILSKMVN